MFCIVYRPSADLAAEALAKEAVEAALLGRSLWDKIPKGHAAKSGQCQNPPSQASGLCLAVARFGRRRRDGYSYTIRYSILQNKKKGRPSLGRIPAFAI